MKVLLAAVVLGLVIAATADAAAPDQTLPVKSAKHEIKAWLVVQAKTGPVLGGSSLVGARSAKCERRSPSHVVCDGLVYWRNDSRKEPRYVCLFPRVSATGGPKGVAVGQGSRSRSICGTGVRADEEVAEFERSFPGFAVRAGADAR